MTLDKNFATQLTNITEAPALFREKMAPRLQSLDTLLRLLVYSPAFTTMGDRTPATLLMVAGDRWLIASDDAEGNISVDECTFSNTLLLALTSILLYGEIRFDFIDDGKLRNCSVYFDTVTRKIYDQAIQMILDGIDGGASLLSPSHMPYPSISTEEWSSQLHNAIQKSIPNGQRLLDAARWPAMHGRFGSDLAPGAALLLTDRELILIAITSTYGFTVTHFPLIRLAKYQLQPHPRFMALDLEMHAWHGGEILQILFPTTHVETVSRVMAHVINSPQKSS